MNAYKIDGPAIISFSGGATSGFMLYQILKAHVGKLPNDVVPVFANTGLEHEKTLEFVKKCEEKWGVKIHWIEYQGKNMPAKIVDFDNASRNGEPFKMLINERKYLPNPITRFCTVELKIRLIDKYGKATLGFVNGHKQAVGLRFDEPHRVHRINGNRRRNEAICPMFTERHNLDDVESFWRGASFNLGIPRVYGNCVGCFLKGRAKMEFIAKESPSHLEWWADAEEQGVKFNKEGFAKKPTFRSDRPSYRGLINMANQQKTFDYKDSDTIPCDCTE